jgi:hypothetical protein
MFEPVSTLRIGRGGRACHSINDRMEFHVRKRKIGVRIKYTSAHRTSDPLRRILCKQPSRNQNEQRQQPIHGFLDSPDNDSKSGLSQPRLLQRQRNALVL